jgi:hypothetical protein|tara:strand:+ start:841 stop:1071 length:231 start_codon:yes stop_codon:yes gene_type:complete
MNFVGPFAQSEQNINLFLTGLIHLQACNATVEMLTAIDDDNVKLEAANESEALTINKLDQESFLELLFLNPILKDA